MRKKLGMVFLLVALFAGCRGSDPRPNLILVTVDCLRVDSLAAYGGPEGLSPHLNKLAEDGVTFELAWAPMATTHPSHASMLTGFYPRYHGVRWNGDVMREDIGSVAEWLSTAGYETGAFVSYKSMLTRAGLGRGFGAVSDSKPSADPIRGSTELLGMVRDWLGALGEGGPAFLWVHFFEPHGPFLWTDYAREKLGDYEGLLADEPGVDAIRRLRKQIVGSADEMAALRVFYDGEVRAADQRIGELLKMLEQAGLLGNSVVVVAGDHGQGLGEAGYIGHGARLDEVVLRVPLVVKDFRKADFAGLRIPEGVGLVDIAPTLAELAEESPPIGLQGRSLLAALAGRHLGESVYFAETERRPGKERSGGAAVYRAPLKLVLDGDDSELWEVHDDGLLERRLGGTAARRSAVDSLVPALEAFLADEWQGETREALSPAELEELRGLGYIE